jgi:hypothetical protein
MPIKIVVAVVFVAAAWAFGFWPERAKRMDLERRLLTTEGELAQCQQRARVAALLGRLLTLEDAVSAKNYGMAQGFASSLFDALRAEAPRSAGTALAPVLQAALDMRDPVTVGLTRADPAVLDAVRAMQGRFRVALGYEPPGGGVPSPPPPTTPGASGS